MQTDRVREIQQACANETTRQLNYQKARIEEEERIAVRENDLRYCEYIAVRKTFGRLQRLC